MTYQERGSGPPHFDGKNYQMWQSQMDAFLHGKGQILRDVIVNTSYVHMINFLAPGSRDMHDTNKKAANYCVNPNSIGFRQRTWLVGFGSS
jgi:hypothetical protein